MHIQTTLKRVGPRKLRHWTMSFHCWLLMGALGAATLVTQTLCADDTNTVNTNEIIKQLQERISELEKKVTTLERNAAAAQETPDARAKQRIEELDQQVKILARDRELDQEAATAAAKTTPVITAGANGFSFRSADTNFLIALRGLVQLDSRSFFADNPRSVGNDTLLLRRARPILQGTVFRDFDFVLAPDFGGSTVQIADAYLNYRYRPELQLQAGKLKPPVGLEHLQGDSNGSFNERSLATDLVPNRDVGAELHGDVLGGAVGYAAGIFNGAPDYSTTTANSDYDDNKAFAGRLFLQPFKQSSLPALQGLGFGLAGSYEVDRAGTNTASTGLTPGFNTDGQQKFFTYSPTNGTVFANGTHWRLSPQGYYYFGPFSLLGEYVISDQQVRTSKGSSADLQHTAWEMTGGCVLTGEAASSAGVVPQHPFDPRNGGWGAVQLVGHYAELNVDRNTFPTFADLNTSASGAHAWAVGLNWFLNRDIRVNTSFSRTTFDGGNGAKATVTKQPENVLFTRLQLAF